MKAFVLGFKHNGRTLWLMPSGNMGSTNTVPRVFSKRHHAEAAIPFSRVHVADQFAPVELHPIEVLVHEPTWIDRLLGRVK